MTKQLGTCRNTLAHNAELQTMARSFMRRSADRRWQKPVEYSLPAQGKEVKMSITFSTSTTTAALAAYPRPVHPQSENLRRQSWDLHEHRASVANVFDMTDERLRHAPAVLALKRILRALNKPGHMDEVGHATAAWARTPAGSKK